MLIIDCRDGRDFLKASAQNSLFVGYWGGDFSDWMGKVVKDKNQTINIITKEGTENELYNTLDNLGYQSIVDVSKKIPKPRKIAHIQADNLIPHLDEYLILDVREKKEVEKIKIAHSINLPLSEILDGALPPETNQTYYVHCAGGYRSLIAISVMLRNGILDVTNIDGGIEAIVNQCGPLCRDNYLTGTDNLTTPEPQ